MRCNVIGEKLSFRTYCSSRASDGHLSITSPTRYNDIIYTRLKLPVRNEHVDVECVCYSPASRPLRSHGFRSPTGLIRIDSVFGVLARTVRSSPNALQCD